MNIGVPSDLSMALLLRDSVQIKQQTNKQTTTENKERELYPLPPSYSYSYYCIQSQQALHDKAERGERKAGNSQLEKARREQYERSNQRSKHDDMSSPNNHHGNPIPKSRIRQRDEKTALLSSSQPPPPTELAAQQQQQQQQQDKIRQDWIDAVFGASFFPRSSQNSTGSAPTPSTPTTPTKPTTPTRQPTPSTTTYQGTGAAHIPHYVAYAARIPPPPPAFGEHSSSFVTALEQSRAPKLGLTLSKLTLGLYVKRVVADSDAALAGVLPNSILVSINGMGLLVEPSRHALERLWQYEGLFRSSSHSHSSTGRFSPLFFY